MRPCTPARPYPRTSQRPARRLPNAPIDPAGRSRRLSRFPTALRLAHLGRSQLRRWRSIHHPVSNMATSLDRVRRLRGLRSILAGVRRAALHVFYHSGHRIHLGSPPRPRLKALARRWLHARARTRSLACLSMRRQEAWSIHAQLRRPEGHQRGRGTCHSSLDAVRVVVTAPEDRESWSPAGG
jgi:hypothetical protein